MVSVLNFCFFLIEIRIIQLSLFSSKNIDFDENFNEIYLYNLPYNNVWKFRLSIYDQNFNKWSKFSYPSSQLNLEISIKINYYF
jgi:hypothetical protein